LVPTPVMAITRLSFPQRGDHMSERWRLLSAMRRAVCTGCECDWTRRVSSVSSSYPYPAARAMFLASTVVDMRESTDIATDEATRYDMACRDHTQCTLAADRSPRGSSSPRPRAHTTRRMMTRRGGWATHRERGARVGASASRRCRSSLERKPSVSRETRARRVEAFVVACLNNLRWGAACLLGSLLQHPLASCHTDVEGPHAQGKLAGAWRTGWSAEGEGPVRETSAMRPGVGRTYVVVLLLNEQTWPACSPQFAQ